MTEPAAIQADYRFAKPVPTRSCYVLQIEVPWEDYEKVNAALGAPPKPGESRWVAIARLAPAGGERKENNGLTKKTAAAPATPHPHGDYAAKLYKSGFFLNEAVCQALGSDDDYLAWIRQQPSCLDGDTYNVEACHVRRASNSGTGYKPKYSAVPMTHAQHQLQHQFGEHGVLNRTNNEVWDAQRAKTWFWQKRCEHVQKWGKSRLKAHFKADSLADIPPERIREWAEEKGLTVYLPTPTKE